MQRLCGDSRDVDSLFDAGPEGLMMAMVLLGVVFRTIMMGGGKGRGRAMFAKCEISNFDEFRGLEENSFDREGHLAFICGVCTLHFRFPCSSPHFSTTRHAYELRPRPLYDDAYISIITVSQIPAPPLEPI